ncbi:hypothetical protein UlMin_004486 [Ulmus minor]
MGTKIEYTINPLRASPNSNRVTLNRVDDWDFNFQNIGVKVNCTRSEPENKIRSSMDRMLDKYNVDSIKKTMQMHDDIFKHQVRELHRLYTVQKMLMGELKKEIKQSRHWDPTTSTEINNSQLINWQQSATRLASGAVSLQIQSLREDLNSRERSGSCSGDTMKVSRGFDLERPAEEAVSTGVSATAEEDQGGRINSNIVLKSSKMSLDGLEEDSEVELTLSIGSSLSKKRSKPQQLQVGNSGIKELDSSASFKSDRGGESSDPNTPMSSSSATFEQERKQPHWLFHGLKLK